MEMKKYYEVLARNLRAERARSKMSRVKLSMLSGISVETIGSIERETANPTIDTLVSLAVTLNVDLNTLLPL